MKKAPVRCERNRGHGTTQHDDRSSQTDVGEPLVPTIPSPARLWRDVHTPPGDNRGDLAEALVPLAARLVATVHDEGPDAVAEALASVPGGRLDALCVVLAAMVDPDVRPSELLAWTQFTPAQHAERERLVAVGVRTRAADVLAAQIGARSAA